MEEVRKEEAQGGPEEALTAMKAVGDALGSMMDGAADGGIPPQALEKLEAANAAYQEFLSLVTGEGNAPKQALPIEQAGTGAVPVR